MGKVYLQSVVLSKLNGKSFLNNGSMYAHCVCGAFFVFCLYWNSLMKFPLEPPAFTLVEVGGGDGNLTIPFGESVL